MKTTQDQRGNKRQTEIDPGLYFSAPQTPISTLISPAGLKRFNIIRTEQPDEESIVDLESPRQYETKQSLRQGIAKQNCLDGHIQNQISLGKKLEFKELKKQIKDQLDDHGQYFFQMSSIQNLKLEMHRFVFKLYPAVECFLLIFLIFARLFLQTYEQLLIFHKLKRREGFQFVSILSLLISIQILSTFFRLTSMNQGQRSEAISKRLFIDFLALFIDLLLLFNFFEGTLKLQILWLITCLNTLRLIRFFVKQLHFILQKLYQQILVYLIDYYILALTLAALMTVLEDDVSRAETLISNLCCLLNLSTSNISREKKFSAMFFPPMLYSSFILYSFQLIQTLRLFRVSLTRKYRIFKHENDEKVLSPYSRFYLRRFRQILQPFQYQKLNEPVFEQAKLSILKNLTDLSRIFSDQFLKKMATIGTFKFQEHYLNFQQNNNLVVVLKSRAFLQTHLTQKFQINEKIRRNLLIGSTGFFTGLVDQRQFRIDGRTTMLSVDYNQFLQILQRFPLEKEKYHLFRHNFIFNGLNILQMKCSNCDKNHLTSSCPLISYKPQRSSVIQEYLKSQPNQRDRFRHRCLRKKIKTLKIIQDVQRAQVACLQRSQPEDQKEQKQKQTFNEEDENQDIDQLSSSSNSPSYSIPETSQFHHQDEVIQSSNGFILDDLKEDSQNIKWSVDQISNLAKRASIPFTNAQQLRLQPRGGKEKVYTIQTRGDSDLDLRETINKLPSVRLSLRLSQLPVVLEEEACEDNRLESVSPIKKNYKGLDSPAFKCSSSTSQFITKNQNFVYLEDNQFQNSYDIDQAREYEIFFPNDNISVLLRRLK